MAAACEDAEGTVETVADGGAEAGAEGRAAAAARNDAGRRAIAMFLCLFDSNMWNVLHWSTYIIIDVAPPGTEQRNPHSSHMSDKLPVCLSVWLSFSLCVCLSVCLSLPVCLFVRFYFRHFGWLVAVAFQRDESLTGSHHTPPPLPPPLPIPQFVGFCCRWLWFCCACVCVRVCTRFLSCCYCCKTTMRFHSQLSSCLFVRVTLLSSGVRACVCVCLLSYVSCIVQSSQ